MTPLTERITDPAAEPLTLESAKRQCNVDLSEKYFDPWFLGSAEQLSAIKAARELVEKDSCLAFMPQVYSIRYTNWMGFIEDGRFELPVHPVRSLVEAVGVQYYDSNGDLQALDNADFEIIRTRTRSYLSRVTSNTSLPSATPLRQYPIEIRVNAGFSSSTDPLPVQQAAVPQTAKLAMAFLVGHWFRNREAVVVGTINSELDHGYKALIRSIRGERYR